MKIPLVRFLLVLLVFSSGFVASLAAQDRGRIEGQVILAETGDPLHAATVVILELDRYSETDEEGGYRFANIPTGAYHVVAHVSSAMTQVSERVVVGAGETVTANFTLSLADRHDSINVTASGAAVTAMEALQPVDSLNSFELAQEIAPAIGETLANRPGNGIAKRSFGPGTDRPIIRGFDGDRVMIMQDGIRTGTLSSQSGDHGELINTGSLDRIEIVKGPAALLYGGSAVGGVVNTISRHHAIHEHAHQGLRGYISGTGGSANGFASGSAGVEYGAGKWMMWGGFSGQSSGDYDTPEGKIPNSDTKLWNGYGGLGYYGDRMFFAAGVNYDEGVYGVPFADELHGHGDEHDEHDEDHDEHGEDHDEHGEEHDEHGEDHDEHDEELERVELDARRQNYRVNWGLRNLSGAIQQFVLRGNYSRWIHDEVEVFPDGDTAVGTKFDNKQFIYRGSFEQRRSGPLSGRFGFWGMLRDYTATGEEALAPPTEQWALAGFVLEEVDLERVKLQFGARVEHNNFDPAMRPEGDHDHDEGDHDEDDHDEGDHDEGDHDEGDHDEEEAPDPVKRRYTGFSGSAGANFRLWQGGAFVANYTHSYRPPALEELYNFGPHVGNLAFEIGSPTLDAERGNGVDLSLRHQAERFRLEGNFYYYDFSDFIFPFDTGEERDGLMEIQYAQADSRFLGTELNGDLLLAGRGSGPHNLWLNLGLDYVDAEEKNTRTTLPRIPPLRGRIGFDWHWKGLEVRPELLLADRQSRTFALESETAGYVLGNIKASYTFTRGRFIHQFAMNTFNLGNVLYRNHSSFIKDLAPEIGRGVRFTYRVRFF